MKKEKTPFYACTAFPTTNNRFPANYENRIVCSDCLPVLQKLPGNCIDLILSSPPYNFGVSYDTANDCKEPKAYFDGMFAVLTECVRVLKYGGRLVLNVQPVYSDYLPTHQILCDFLRKQGLIWKTEIIWDKSHYNCGSCRLGSFKSPSSPYFKSTFEYIEVFCKGSLKHPGLSSDADITKEEYTAWTNTVWKIAPERNMKEYGHPAMFPAELAERVIKLFSFCGDVVLDPYNGAGTTTAVADALGRRYLGIDISKAYCDAAEERLETFSMQ